MVQRFNARVVDGQGNPLANQIVTFNVNGVFYNKVTNDEGIASLNIRSMKGNTSLLQYTMDLKLKYN